MRRSLRLGERRKQEKEEEPPVSVRIEIVDNKDGQRPSTSKTTANIIISRKSTRNSIKRGLEIDQSSSKIKVVGNKAKGNRRVSPSPEPVKEDLAEEKRKRLRLSADQRTLIDATSILAPPSNTPALNPLSIDHVRLGFDLLIKLLFYERTYDLKMAF